MTQYLLSLSEGRLTESRPGNWRRSHATLPRASAAEFSSPPRRFPAVYAIAYATTTGSVELQQSEIRAKVASMTSASATQPTAAARELALRLLGAAWEVGVTFERAMPDPDGGIALYAFGSHVKQNGARDRVARVGVTNDGTIVYLLERRALDVHELWSVDAGASQHDSLERVRRFVAAV